MWRSVFSSWHSVLQFLDELDSDLSGVTASQLILHKPHLHLQLNLQQQVQDPFSINFDLSFLKFVVFSPFGIHCA